MKKKREIPFRFLYWPISRLIECKRKVVSTSLAKQWSRGKCRGDEKLRGKTSLRGNVCGIGPRMYRMEKTILRSGRFTSAVIDHSPSSDTVRTVSVARVRRWRDLFKKKTILKNRHADLGARFLPIVSVRNPTRNTLCITAVAERASERTDANPSFHTQKRRNHQTARSATGAGPFPIYSDGSQKCVSRHYTWFVTDRVSERCGEIRYRRLVETALFVSGRPVCASKPSPDSTLGLYRCLDLMGADASNGTNILGRDVTASRWRLRSETIAVVTSSKKKFKYTYSAVLCGQKIKGRY